MAGGDPDDPREADGGDTVDALVASFVAWTAEVRAGEAAAGRSRRRWLHQQASESATWLGTLLDLAEAEATVVLTVGARSLPGRLAAVGTDVCVLAERRGVTVVAVDKVTGVRVAGRGDRSARDGRDPRGGGLPTGATTGSRRAPLGLDLAGALGLLAADRSPVRIHAGGPDAVRGVLLGVGVDVVSLGPDGAPGVQHLPLRAVETVAPAR